MTVILTSSNMEERHPSLLTIALGNSGGFTVVLWDCVDGNKINNYHFLWDEGADPQGQRVPSTPLEKEEPRVTALSTTDCRARFEAILHDISSSTCDVVLSGVVPSKLALLEEMLEVMLYKASLALFLIDLHLVTLERERSDLAISQARSS